MWSFCKWNFVNGNDVNPKRRVGKIIALILFSMFSRNFNETCWRPTPHATTTHKIFPPLRESDTTHTLQPHTFNKDQPLSTWIMQTRMVQNRQASRLPNSVCVRPSWQPVSATLWWCKWGVWPAVFHRFWYPAETSMFNTGVFFGMHVFWTWAPFFWTCTFFLAGRNFAGLGGAKNVGDVPVCFSDPVGIFCWTCMYLCWTRGFCFWTSKWIVSELGFFFWTRAPASWTLPPWGGGGPPCYRHSHWAGHFWTLAPSFFEPVHFLDLAQGGGNLDVETRCMQKIVDAGKLGYWNKKNVRSGGGANEGSLRMKRNGCRKWMGEGTVRYWNRMSANSCWEIRVKPWHWI